MTSLLFSLFALKSSVSYGVLSSSSSVVDLCIHLD